MKKNVIQYKQRNEVKEVAITNAQSIQDLYKAVEINGKPLHKREASNKISVNQVKDRLSKTFGCELIFIRYKGATKFGSYSAIQGTEKSEFEQGIEKAQERAKTESQETEKVETKTETSGIEVESKKFEIDPEKPKKSKLDHSKLDGLGAFAEILRPYFEQAEIDQEQIGRMIDTAISKHSKSIEIVTPNGETQKMGRQHKSFEDLMYFVMNRLNVLLVGPAGSFKTTTAEKVAEALKLEFGAISVGMMTTKTDFLGYMDANGNYVSTEFRRRFENGGVFLLDELDAGNANVITTINMALANDMAAFADGMVKKHKDFVLIAGANTFGTGANREYVGRNQLDAATLNRFNVINWDYDEALELILAKNDRWTKYCQALRRNAAKTQVRHVISPRQSIEGAKMLAAGMAFNKVCKYVVFKNLEKKDIDKLTNGITY